MRTVPPSRFVARGKEKKQFLPQRCESYAGMRRADDRLGIGRSTSEEQVMQTSRETGGQQSCQVNVGQMERLACVVAGGTMLMTMGGLRSLRGAAATAIGAGLIWRGVTGHCGLYQRLGIDTAESEGTASREQVEA
jgi:Protein of unknown function (DUF2892)